MSMRRRPIPHEDIRRAFEGDLGRAFPPIMTPAQLGKALKLSVKTIYLWIAKGRLDGAFRKRGKHVLVWRDRAIEIILNGPDWTNDK